MAPSPPSGEITEILNRWGGTDQGALRELCELLYGDLRAIASRHVHRERAGHTLDATALVHELYLRLRKQRIARWENRHQFFAVASRIMRRVLVDHARGLRRRAVHVSLADDMAGPGPDIDLLALDDALERLGARFPREAETVVMRYFGGLTLKETAGELGVSLATVKRDWEFARAWLLREIDGSASGERGG